ncbi:LURP-one-related/scramblase family protein [Planctomicrobium piriforme]|uniref:Uncharacterized protein YxjI n=1 Tax=Planctomicrobium piriforme TaxID=1576369 RepID=A0A1I3FZE9_9PLAN|nr:LURP-one-related family protein [Planctomicrobium piriforme]SFI16605.1 Uncharacterized protein YxjI [Planctomicrobium piriforme]
MIYRIKEQFWTFGESFFIFDGDGQKVFHVDGAAFSWGDKLSFRDLDDNELAHITQEIFSWMPRYAIYRNGQLFAEVRKEWSWSNKTFTLDVPGPNDYVVEGSFWKHEYTFTRQGRQVAKVSKAIWSWGDSYGVEIVDGEDDISILATMIVIDQVVYEHERQM